MKIVLSGYGKMGKMLEEQAALRGHEILARIDIDNVDDFASLPKADAVLDFSHPGMLPFLAEYIRRTGTALCSGTTAFGEQEYQTLAQLAEYAPVLHSANYSLGIAVFRKMLEQFAPMLREGFDVEVVEKHHNQKVDAPSGTAKLLLDAVNPAGEFDPVYGREGMCGKRPAKEIGVHALRGGTVAGTHTVHFFGQDEEVALTHRATSRRIFAAGAVAAAKKIVSREAGFYSFDELMFG